MNTTDTTPREGAARAAAAVHQNALAAPREAVTTAAHEGAGPLEAADRAAEKPHVSIRPAKKLGFGCMRLPHIGDDHAKIDMPEFERMIDEFLGRGFNYFDTAWMYHEHMSERAVGEALVARHPRESFTLATKMPLSELRERGADEAEQTATFNEQLCRLGTDYVDYYLAHNVNVNNFEVAKRLHTFEFIAEQKRTGRVRHMGFSFHDTADLLDQILTEHPEVDFVQLQINWLDWGSPTIQSGKCYDVAVAHGVPVVVMEPIKGGTLANLPAAASRELLRMAPDATPADLAIRYAASLDNVMCVLSGMSTPEQLDENARFMADFQPIADAMRGAFVRAAHAMRAEQAIPCTSCRYCTRGCPKHIDIPTYFAAYNAFKRGQGAGHEQMYYRQMVKRQPGPADCIKCGRCETACPQHIFVRDMLVEVDRALAAEG